MNQQDFLRRVWGRSEGWAFVGRSDHKGTFLQRPYKYPGELGSLLKTVEKRHNTWASVYFCVHLCNTDKKRVKESAKPVNCLWIDLDEGNPHDIKPKPTICWSTSKDRYQAIWLLDKPADPHTAEKINRHLTYSNGGDKGKWALTTYLRIPLTLNHKHEPPYKGYFLWDDGPTYTLDELRPEENTEVSELIDVTTTTSMPENLPSYESVLQSYGNRFSATIWQILNRSPQKGDDWSETLWQLERLLLETGLPPDVVFVVCKNSKWNKYARDNRPDSHLWNDILKASAESNTAPVTTGLPWVGLDTLMTHHRKPEWLVEGIWMESNVGWIAGVGKSYKSTLSLDLALSIASGKPFLGKFKVNKPGPVLMVQEEDPIWRVSRRVQAMSRWKDLSPTRLEETMHGLSLKIDKDLPVPLYSCIGSGFNFADPDKVALLESAIAEYKPRFVLLDPWFQLTPGIDEFKSSEVVEVLTRIKQWRNKYDCAVGIVHHYTKGGGSSDGRDRLYGSMAFYAWSENSMFVNRKPDGNIVEVTRDIKDARTDKPLYVEFNEIDEDYDFAVLDGPQLAGKSIKQSESSILSYLLSCEIGDEVPRSDIVKAVKYSGKTVSKELKTLEDEGKIELTYQGQGGKAFVKLLPSLFEGVSSFEL